MFGLSIRGRIRNARHADARRAKEQRSNITAQRYRDLPMASSRPCGRDLGRMMDTNFHEKASLVKAAVPATMTACVIYPCHASIRTLGELTLFGSSVHRMRSVLIRVLQTLQSSERSLRRNATKSACAVAFRSETIGQPPPSSLLGSPCAGLITSSLQ
jgi:hypothetical protein